MLETDRQTESERERCSVKIQNSSDITNRTESG